jgi:hypothetical protein
MTSIKVEAPDGVSEQEARSIAERSLQNRHVLKEAIEEAKQREEINPGNEEARELLEVLRNPSQSPEAVVEELFQAIESMNQFAILRGSTRSSPEELEDRIYSLINKCGDLDGYFGEAMTERLEGKKEMLSSETNYVDHYGVEQRVNELSSFIKDFMDNENSGKTDLDMIKRCEEDLEDFKIKYFTGPRGENYNNLIPNHFAATVKKLLQEAEDQHQKGNIERAEGIVEAAEILLSDIKGLYEDRGTQQQLVELKELRS